MISRSRFLPVTLEVRNMGITSSVEVILENSTAFSIYLMTLGAFSGYSSLSVFLIRITVSISPYLSSLSKWVTTTIRGRWNIFASSMQLVFSVLLTPETIHRAYSGKKEHRLETTCFSL